MTSRHQLLALVHRHAAREAHAPITLGEIADELGASAFSILCALLSLPFLTPLPLGPMSVAAGLALGALGAQVLRGDAVPALPRRARRLVLRPRLLGAVMRTLERTLALLGRCSRPRHAVLVEGALGVRVRGLVTLASGLLMAVPLFALPFNNFLPALAVLLVSLAELEDDGLLAVLAIVVTGLAAVYVIGVWAAVLVLGREALGFVW